MTRIALLGAECTGKSTLTAWLAERGHATVPEVLRDWCLRSGRTPQREEQRAIAEAQWQGCERQLTAGAPCVISDTTPLMTALYSLHYFGDDSLLPWAIACQRQFSLTLLCCPEGIPWQADGWLRDGDATRQRTHAELVALLLRERLPYTLLAGTLAARQQQLQALML